MGWPWISRKSSARMLGPLSRGLPDPLNTRPAVDINLSGIAESDHTERQNDHTSIILVGLVQKY